MPIYHGAVWRGKMDYQQRRQEGDAALIVGGSEVSSSPLLAVVRRVQIFRRDWCGHVTYYVIVLCFCKEGTDNNWILVPYLELKGNLAVSSTVLLKMTFMNCIHDLGLCDLRAIEHGSMRGMISIKRTTSMTCS